MWSKKIEDLVPEAQEPAIAFLQECRKAGFDVVVTCTVRSKAAQRALFAQGRDSLEAVNGLRKAIGLWEISEGENRKVVTWTLESNHLPDEKGKGRALDFAIRKDKQFIWNPKADVDADGIPDYEECGKIAESLGWEWGGRWKKPDMPHIQWPKTKGGV